MLCLEGKKRKLHGTVMSRYSQVGTFYTAILAGNTVKIAVSNASEFNTIRTSLHRYHRLVREIGGSELSLLATLDGQEASYCLGERKHTRKEYAFTIEEHGTQV